MPRHSRIQFASLSCHSRSTVNLRISLAVLLVVLMLAASQPTPGSADNSRPPGSDAAAGLVPDRDILYRDTEIPPWKAAWDQARELSRQKKYEQALARYQGLLAGKANVDEARWEYTSILLYLKRWDRAGEQLDILLRNDPKNRRYLLARARVDLASGLVDQAVAIFGRLYEEQPAADDAVQALSGLIQALEEKKKGAIILPLVEQLILRRPDDAELKIKAADLAADNGQIDKARDYLRTVLGQHPHAVQALRRLALLSERQGEPGTAASYWQLLLANDTNDVQAHRHLARYFDRTDNRVEELRHVMVLLDMFPADTALLKRAGELNLQTGRADRALDYFTRYLVLRPDDLQVQGQQEDARRELAASLLALVENAKTQELWQDLVKVTADRVGVYRAMADLLRQQGKRRELTEVLRIIHQQEPGDLEVAAELDRLEKELAGRQGGKEARSPDQDKIEK